MRLRGEFYKAPSWTACTSLMLTLGFQRTLSLLGTTSSRAPLNEPPPAAWKANAPQPSIVRIAYELGISDQLVFADESLPPWVNHNGKLHPLPKGKGGKGPKGQLELVLGSNGVLKFGLAGERLSWPGKIRAAIGAFVGPPPPPEGYDETIREWVSRTLGEEVFLRCIDELRHGWTLVLQHVERSPHRGVGLGLCRLSEDVS